MAIGRQSVGFGGDLGITGQVKAREERAIAQLRDQLRTTVDALDKVGAGVESAANDAQRMVTQLVSAIRGVDAALGQFANLTAAQMVDNDAAVQRLVTAYNDGVARVQQLMAQLNMPEAPDVDLGPVLTDVTTLFGSAGAAVDRLNRATARVAGAVDPTTVRLFSEIAQAMAGDGGKSPVSVDSVGRWSVPSLGPRSAITLLPAADYDEVVLGIARSVHGFVDIVKNIPEQADKSKLAQLPEVAAKLQTSIKSFNRQLSRLAAGEVDADGLGELLETMHTVVSEATTSANAALRRTDPDAAAETVVNALTLLASVRTAREAAQNWTAGEAPVKNVLDAMSVVQRRFEGFNAVATDLLRRVAVNAAVEFGEGVRTRVDRLDGMLANRTKGDEVDLMIAGRTARRVVFGPGDAEAADLALLGRRTAADRSRSTLPRMLGAGFADANRRLMRVGVRVEEDLRRLFGSLDRRKLDEPSAAAAARGDFEQAATLLTGVADAQLDVNRRVNIPRGAGALLQDADKQALTATMQSTTRLVGALTALIDTAEQLGVPKDNARLKRLRLQREELLDSRKRLQDVGDGLKTFTKGLATAKDALAKGFAILTGGLAMIGAGTLVDRVLNPTRVVSDVFGRMDMLGRMDYATARADLAVGLNVNQASNDVVGFEAGRRMFEATAGLVDIDAPAKAYADFLRGVGGHYGGDRAQLRADAQHVAPFLAAVQASTGASAGTLQNYLKVFYKDAGESAQDTTNQLVRLIDRARATGVPFEKLVATSAELAASMRDLGVSSRTVSGALNALQEDRHMRIEDAARLLQATAQAAQNTGTDWGQSIFMHAAMGKPGSMFRSVRDNLISHDAGGNPREGYYDNLVDQMFAMMDVVGGAHGLGNGGPQGLLMLDKELRSMGYGGQRERSTILSAVAGGDKDALRDALKAADAAQDKSAPVDATKVFMDRLVKAKGQLAALDKIEGSYKLMIADTAQSTRRILAGPLSTLVGLAETAAAGFVKLIDKVIDKIGGFFTNGLGARWLDAFKDDPVKVGLATLAGGSLGMGALSRAPGALLGAAGRFLSAGGARGMVGRGALLAGMAVGAGTLLSVGLDALIGDDRTVADVLQRGDGKVRPGERSWTTWLKYAAGLGVGALAAGLALRRGLRAVTERTNRAARRRMRVARRRERISRALTQRQLAARRRRAANVERRREALRRLDRMRAKSEQARRDKLRSMLRQARRARAGSRFGGFLLTALPVGLTMYELLNSGSAEAAERELDVDAELAKLEQSNVLDGRAPIGAADLNFDLVEEARVDATGMDPQAVMERELRLLEKFGSGDAEHPGRMSREEVRWRREQIKRIQRRQNALRQRKGVQYVSQSDLVKGEAKVADEVASDLQMSAEDLKRVQVQAFADHGRDYESVNDAQRIAWLRNFQIFMEVYGSISQASAAASRATLVDMNQLRAQAGRDWDAANHVKGNWYQERAKELTGDQAYLAMQYNAVANYYFHADDDETSEYWRSHAANLRALMAGGNGDLDEKTAEKARQEWQARWAEYTNLEWASGHAAFLKDASDAEIRRFTKFLAEKYHDRERAKFIEATAKQRYDDMVTTAFNAGDLDIRTVRPYSKQAMLEALQRRRPEATMEMVEKIIAAAERNGIDPVFFMSSLIYEGGSLKNMGNVTNRKDDQRFGDFDSVDEGLDKAAASWSAEISRAGTGNIWHTANIYAPQEEDERNRNYVPNVTSIMNEIYGQNLVNPGENPIAPGQSSWGVGPGAEASPRPSSSGALPTGGYIAEAPYSEEGFDTRYMEKWESSAGMTDLANVQTSVKAAWNALAKEYGGGLRITGGAEKGVHAGGAYGHEGGWKLDVDVNSVGDREKFLALCRKYGFKVGDEGNHYDLAGHRQGGVGGTVVASPDLFVSDGGGGGGFQTSAGLPTAGIVEEKPRTLSDVMSDQRARYDAVMAKAGARTVTGGLRDNLWVVEGGSVESADDVRKRLRDADGAKALAKQLEGEAKAVEIRAKSVNTPTEEDEDRAQSFRTLVDGVIEVAQRMMVDPTVVLDGEVLLG